MKNMLVTCVLIYLFVSAGNAYSQKLITDCTITYTLSAEDNSLDSNVLKNAYKKFYVSGGKSLTELAFSGFKQLIFYNENNKNVDIFYEINGEKYMRVLDKDQWKQQYKDYKKALLQYLDETKKIAGYVCKKVIITLQNGRKVNAYYTPEIKTSIGENPYEFADVKGLVLQYEAIIQNKYKIAYTVSDINFNPVPYDKFDTPKKGYRLLSSSD